MRNKKMILISLTGIFLLAMVALFIFIDHQQNEYNNIFDNVRAGMSCAKEGETIGAAGIPSSCCSGLKAISGWPGGYSGDCTLPPPPTGLGICVQCGDDKCDINNGENKCNCKEDCR
jgi:hypothetical protein